MILLNSLTQFYKAKNMKPIAVILTFFLLATSCAKTKDQEEKPVTELSFSKILTIQSATGDASVDIKVSVDNPDILDEINSQSFGLMAQYKINDGTCIPTNVSEPGDYHRPQVLIEVINTKLPPNAKGFTIENKISSLKGLAVDEYRYYEYYSSGIAGARVDFLYQGGQIYVRIGVLWTGSQWFYENLVASRIGPYPGYVQTTPGNEDPFYKIRVRVQIEAIPGDFSVTWISL